MKGGRGRHKACQGGGTVRLWVSMGGGGGRGIGFGLERQAGPSSYKALCEDTVFLRNPRTKKSTEGISRWQADWLLCIGSPGGQRSEVRGREAVDTVAVGGLDGGLKWS